MIVEDVSSLCPYIDFLNKKKVTCSTRATKKGDINNVAAREPTLHECKLRDRIRAYSLSCAANILASKGSYIISRLALYTNYAQQEHWVYDNIRSLLVANLFQINRPHHCLLAA